jgi:cytochrome P450
MVYFGMPFLMKYPDPPVVDSALAELTVRSGSRSGKFSWHLLRKARVKETFMGSMVGNRCPESDIDPFSIEYLASPHAPQARLRELGPVTYLPRYGFYVLARHTSVFAALRDPENFCSGRGVGITDFGKEAPWRPRASLTKPTPPIMHAPHRHDQSPE